LDAILNAMLLPATITHVRQVTVGLLCSSVDSSVRISSVTIACMGLHSL